MEEKAILLADGHKQILKAYTMACHPNIDSGRQEFKDLVKWGLIDKASNHISDRGLAYAIVELGIRFTQFLKWHKSWRSRLGRFINFAQRALDTDEELDIYFRVKYQKLIEYDLFSPDNAERMPGFDLMRTVTAEILLGVLESPKIDWRKVKKLLDFSAAEFAQMDLIAAAFRGGGFPLEEAKRGIKQLGGNTDQLVKSKEDLIRMIKSQMSPPDSASA